MRNLLVLGTLSLVGLFGCSDGGGASEAGATSDDITNKPTVTTIAQCNEMWDFEIADSTQKILDSLNGWRACIAANTDALAPRLQRTINSNGMRSEVLSAKAAIAGYRDVDLCEVLDLADENHGGSGAQISTAACALDNERLLSRVLSSYALEDGPLDEFEGEHSDCRAQLQLEDGSSADYAEAARRYTACVRGLFNNAIGAVLVPSAVNNGYDEDAAKSAFEASFAELFDVSDKLCETATAAGPNGGGSAAISAAIACGGKLAELQLHYLVNRDAADYDGADTE